MTQSDTDQLLRDAAAGDQTAGDELLQRNRARLRAMVAVRIDSRLAARVDPSDVVQDALLIAHQRLPEYLRTRPIPFYPWLRGIAWNRLMDLHRHHLHVRKRTIDREATRDFAINDESVLQLAARLPAKQSSPSQQVMREEMKRRLVEALTEMPEGQREVIVMRQMEGLSVKEVALILEITEGTVKSRHWRGMLALGNALRRLFDE